MSKYLDNFHDWLEAKGYEYFMFESKDPHAPRYKLVGNGQNMLFHLLDVNSYKATIDGGLRDNLPKYGELSLPIPKNDDFLYAGIKWCIDNGYNPHQIPIIVTTDQGIFWAYLADMKMLLLTGYESEANEVKAIHSLGYINTGPLMKYLYPLSFFKPIDTLVVYNTIQLPEEALASELGL